MNLEKSFSQHPCNARCENAPDRELFCSHALLGIITELQPSAIQVLFGCQSCLLPPMWLILLGSGNKWSVIQWIRRARTSCSWVCEVGILGNVGFASQGFVTIWKSLLRGRGGKSLIRLSHYSSVPRSLSLTTRNLIVGSIRKARRLFLLFFLLNWNSTEISSYFLCWTIM